MHLTDLSDEKTSSGAVPAVVACAAVACNVVGRLAAHTEPSGNISANRAHKCCRNGDCRSQVHPPISNNRGRGAEQGQSWSSGHKNDSEREIWYCKLRYDVIFNPGLYSSRRPNYRQ